MGDNPAPAVAPVPDAPAEVNATPTVPAGTRLVLRMAETLDSNKHKTGHRFTVRLEADLVAEGMVVATRGSTAYGMLMSAKQYQLEIEAGT